MAAERRRRLPPPLYRPTDFVRWSDPARLTLGSDPDEPWRSDFRRDYARLIHCASFRRLVGKTQLFSSHESDFFRNRLTHSLEVAQVAKSIATRLNATEPFLRSCGEISTDLVEVAGLAHDLGHPPFGHNGEEALDQCMSRYGGFEGNAQTLRILSRLEKKRTTDPDNSGVSRNGIDLRFGLDLCARTLGAILKYDRAIPAARRGANRQLVKGYYSSEDALVAKIKRAIAPNYRGSFKTLECAIMDIADDISYSTYDLEDAFKAGFLSPIEMLAADQSILSEIAAGIHRRGRVANVRGSENVTSEDVRGVLLNVFAEVMEDEDLRASLNKNSPPSYDELIRFALNRYSASRTMAKNGYERTQITAALVGWFIHGIRFTPDNKYPALSKVHLEENVWITVEVLKRFCFASLINSPRLKVAEHRGKEIVKNIFEYLSSDDGYQLLPEDFRDWYLRLRTKTERMRVVCDFIAGMTDRYAVEFHARLRSDAPQSMFKPI